MTFMVFLLTVMCIMASSILIERDKETGAPIFQHQLGLWQWLTTGNWPAKLGAGLMVVGVGALLKYLIVHTGIPDIVKFGSGIALTLVFAGAAAAIYKQEGRRPVALALAGAALGIAYLTAFSAYAFFNYVTIGAAFDMLVIVCVIGVALAIRLDSISMAVLAMFGAYIAPLFTAFLPVYPFLFIYYMVISGLCLYMISRRGWRPVMHLSFLFTMLGATSFAHVVSGWHYTEYFRQAPFFALLLSLLGLQILHLLMLYAEKKVNDNTTAMQARTDAGFLWMIGGTTAFLIMQHVGNFNYYAMSGDAQKFMVFVGSSLVWLVAAGMTSREGSRNFIHCAVISGLLCLMGLLILLPSMEWSIVALAVTVALIYASPRLALDTGRQEWLFLVAFVLSMIYMGSAVNDWSYHQPLTGGQLVYHIINAALLLAAGAIARDRDIQSASALTWIGLGWILVTAAHELTAYDIPPVVISLLIALPGTFLVMIGHQQKSRALWVSGSALMVASTIKMIFFDFGSLGDIANILAMIGAGALFLMVSLIAPYPPARDPEDVKKKPELTPEYTPAYTPDYTRNEVRNDTQDDGMDMSGHAVSSSAVPPKAPVNAPAAVTQSAKTHVDKNHVPASRQIMGIIAVMFAVGVLVISIFFYSCKSHDGGWDFVLLIIFLPAAALAALTSSILAAFAMVRDQRETGRLAFLILLLSFVIVLLPADLFKSHHYSYDSDTTGSIAAPDVVFDQQPTPSPVIVPQRTDSIPAMVSPPVPQSGMTWGALPETQGSHDIVHVSCKSTSYNCNPYQGDTSCTAELPLLCVRDTATPQPADYHDSRDGFHEWTGMSLATPVRVRGTDLTSRMQANKMCADALGTGWRMAEFHDGGGWGFAGRPVHSFSNERFWVAINDQRANCWDQR